MEAILLTKNLQLGPQTLAEYRAEGGYEALGRALWDKAEIVLAAVHDSGLRGRGGAGFPAGQKWQMVADETGTPKYVVANGGEDEPGSLKDRLLMENFPHKVLEGVILAAYAVGASEAVLYINSLYERAITQMESAIKEATGQGWIGDRIGEDGYSVSVRIHQGPQEYVAGEDSAALEVIEGKDPLPRQKPPFPVSAGLFGKPTVVNNIETFAVIPAIVRKGAEWFRSQGTEDNPGTMLFTLPANVKRPGVVELPIGTSLRTLIEDYGGGLARGKGVKAVLPGGPSSGLVGAADLDVSMDRQPLIALGSSLGCGAMRIIEEDQCVVEPMSEIAQFFEQESCGQCPSCSMVTQTLAKIMSQVAAGQGHAAMLDQVPKLGMFARGKGFCALNLMPIPPLTTAIKLFPDDFAYHIEHGHCRNEA